MVHAAIQDSDWLGPCHLQHMASEVISTGLAGEKEAWTLSVGRFCGSDKYSWGHTALAYGLTQPQRRVWNAVWLSWRKGKP